MFRQVELPYRTQNWMGGGCAAGVSRSWITIQNSELDGWWLCCWHLTKLNYRTELRTGWVVAVLLASHEAELPYRTQNWMGGGCAAGISRSWITIQNSELDGWWLCCWRLTISIHDSDVPGSDCYQLPRFRFWRVLTFWLGITDFMDFVNRPEFQITKKQRFENRVGFRLQVRGGRHPLVERLIMS
jgi:hypothetical protein